jgi:hypothetical protein
VRRRRAEATQNRRAIAVVVTTRRCRGSRWAGRPRSGTSRAETINVTRWYQRDLSAGATRRQQRAPR